jgi:tRNA modification GTPase
MPDLSDTIFGEMTYPGRSAMRSVRVSGRRAGKVLERLFSSKTDPLEKPRSAVKGFLKSIDGLLLDSVVAIAFPAPDSFTGEDCVEFHCHGSEGVIRGLCSSLSSMGLRQALRGEFSYRAFLAGKITTEEAESLAVLIQAETAIEAHAAAASSSSGVHKRFVLLREKILDLRAKWEARIDFPEDVPQAGSKQWRKELSAVFTEVGAVKERAKRSRPVRDGFRIAIFGAPNSGKSSLFNCLLGKERAIVTPHAGTTRDMIEEKLDIDGIPMVFQDMAGARMHGEKIEKVGIGKALQSAEKADAVLFLFDGRKGWQSNDQEALSLLSRKPFLILATKKDLFKKKNFNINGKILEISNKTGEGVEALIKKLKEWGRRNLPREGLLLLSQRQENSLNRVEEYLREAEKALNISGDELIAAEMVKEALFEMDRFLLSSSTEEIYDLIFSSFCVGK